MDRRIKLGSRPGRLAATGAKRQAFEQAPVPAQDIETVCHRAITGDRAYYPQAEFHGRTIYFCTETCRSVFLSDPERFYTAHNQRRP
jgi:YHS domain-containing protein